MPEPSAWWVCLCGEICIKLHVIIFSHTKKMTSGGKNMSGVGVCVCGGIYIKRAAAASGAVWTSCCCIYWAAAHNICTIFVYNTCTQILLKTKTKQTYIFIQIYTHILGCSTQ